MAEHKKIRCAECRYVRQDVSASDYTRKKCNGCELNACACKETCKCGTGCKFKGTDEICPKQEVKWAAYECGCGESEYFKALLNVTLNGDRQLRVTWGGCENGERRAGV
jgi:hypothetical protein